MSDRWDLLDSSNLIGSNYFYTLSHEDRLELMNQLNKEDSNEMDFNCYNNAPHINNDLWDGNAVWINKHS